MVTRRRGRPPHADILTPAEWRVVHAIQHGMSNREIARRRGISPDAVKYHLTNAIRKLGLANRQALKQWFREPSGSALGRKDKSMTTLALGPLAQISRTVRDIKESEAWYGTTLGLRHLYSFGGFAFFDCGGTRLYLSATEKPGAESILYLRVEDIRSAYDPSACRRQRGMAGALQRSGRAPARNPRAGEGVSGRAWAAAAALSGALRAPQAWERPAPRW